MTKFLLLYIPIISISLSLVGLHIFSEMEKIVVDGILQERENLVKIYAENFRHKLNTYRLELITHASDLPTQNLPNTSFNPETSYSYLDELKTLIDEKLIYIAEENPSFWKIRYIDNQGNEISKITHVGNDIQTVERLNYKTSMTDIIFKNPFL